MDYPNRPSHWSHRFCRTLTKAAAAQDIGPEACWLCTVIAHQEDAKRYRAAVTFYNGQLMPLCGFASEGRLIRARDKAVKSGWLHYEPGGKGRPGIYWTIIPDDCQAMPDSPMDEGADDDFDLQNGRANGGKTKGKRSANGGLTTLALDPNPLPEEERAPELPPKLEKLVNAWNAMPEGIAARIHKPNSDAILKGWEKVQKSPEAREHFEDPAEIVARIRGSPFLHGQNWFRFAWLFGKGKTGEWNIIKVMEGAYRNKKQKGVGPGQRHVGDSSADTGL